MAWALLRRKLFQSSRITGYFKKGERTMLWTILVILLVIWLISFLGGFVTSNLVHLILVIALIVFIINLVSGRRAV